MFRSRCLLLAALFGALLPAPEALAHGSHGGAEGEALEAGEFDFTPVITLEGHGGFDTNLEGDPKHYAIDGMFGGVFQWGLGNGSSLSIEAAVGPTLVWGESEHFYGKVHVDDHSDEESHQEHDHGSHDDHDDHDHGHDDHADEHDHDDDHGDHADDHHDHDDHDHDAHARRSRRQLRAKDHDDHDHSDHDHSDHGHSDHGHDDHGHAHTHDTDFKRTDFKGYVQVRYAPNDRLDLALSWMPYWVTEDEGDDVQGLKNELGAKLTWALGDGDVNFGLGDSFSDLVDGVYVSVDHRQGWESDGVWIGNYTDPRVGLGFKVGGDEVSIRLEAGPRFYTPGSYSGLSQRTDFAGELEVSVPVGDALLFAHWQPVYTPEKASGWGEGWQHHIGTGVSFSF